LIDENYNDNVNERDNGVRQDDDGQVGSQDDVEENQSEWSEMGDVDQDDDIVDVPTMSRQGETESESVVALRLQLALAQEERRIRIEERMAKEIEREREREREICARTKLYRNRGKRESQQTAL